MSPWADRSVFVKIVTVLATAFGIGVGLCGIDYLLAAGGIGKSKEEFGVGPLDGLSILVMILSALGLVVTAIAWVLMAIFRSLKGSGPGDGPPRLFDGDDKKS